MIILINYFVQAFLLKRFKSLLQTKNFIICGSNDTSRLSHIEQILEIDIENMTTK